MTSLTTFWKVIQDVLPSGQWTKLSDLLNQIKSRVQLDDEDLAPASQWQETNLRWERNVRNTLQDHLDIGVERKERGYYRLKQGTIEQPKARESNPPDPPEVQKLKRELEALQGSDQPQAPEVLKRIQRVIKAYERRSRITRYVKRTRGGRSESKTGVIDPWSPSPAERRGYAPGTQTRVATPSGPHPHGPSEHASAIARTQ
jgi:hypothetical protein